VGHLQLIGEEELDEDSLIAVDNQVAEESELCHDGSDLYFHGDEPLGDEEEQRSENEQWSDSDNSRK
jgi:hypothetical protein